MKTECNVVATTLLWADSGSLKLLKTRNNVATKILLHPVFNNLFPPVKLLVLIIHEVSIKEISTVENVWKSKEEIT